MTLVFNKPDNIAGYEYRFSTYCETEDKKNDMHVVKEYTYLKDGKRIPTMRLIPNYERQFWITRPGFRNHNDKKEAEELSKLQSFTSTQSRLNDTISRALYGRPAINTNFRQLAKSQYLYGCDIKTSSLIKTDYEKEYPDFIFPKSSVAALDIETDVVHGTDDIILITLSYGSKVATAINTAYLPDTNITRRQLDEFVEKNSKELYSKRGIEIEYIFCKTPGQCCNEIIKKAHEWKPDFISIWNMNFDLPYIIRTLEKEGFSLKDVFSDPSVPYAYRHFNYIEGSAQKVTQDGSITPLHWADRWHVVDTPSSFYFIDAGCLYKRLRIAKGMEPSYALDFILNKYLGEGKLKVDVLPLTAAKPVNPLRKQREITGLRWHQLMQAHHPVAYVIYNQYDCIRLEQLDENIQDISSSFSTLCGISDYSNFTSNPRKIVDDLHFFYQQHGKVIATTGSNMKDEKDELVVSMRKWIVTLPAFMVDGDTGISVIKDLPSVKSMIRIHLADLDIEGTYPTIEVVANISKETTVRELSRIEGLTEDDQRMVGINLSGGHANALEICQMTMGLATPEKWLELYQASKHTL